MPKLNELKGKECLPKKRQESIHDTHTMDDNWCYNCSCIVEHDELPVGNHKFNEAINAYNNIDIDGDEKILTILLQDKFMRTKHQAMVVSKEIISRMNEWVVIKNKQ